MLSRVVFRWDQRKAESNYRKHGVRFADAVGVFDDEFALTLREEIHSSEYRYVTVGTDFLGHVVTVVYTYLNDDVRIISARRSTKIERKEYEREIRF